MNKITQKIYVTGASGFIGSKIATSLNKQGHKVVGLSRKNCNILKDELNIDIIETNLLDFSNIKLEKADCIIHCATANDVLSKDFRAGIDLSVLGTKNLLESAVKSKINNIIFLSTAQIYGTELQGVIDEDSPINCENSYGLNHFFGEELCKMYCKNYNLNIISLRPSNVFGVPKVSTVNRKTLVPFCFVDDSMDKSSINLLSSGKQKRNFVSTNEIAMIVSYLIQNFPKGFAIRNAGSNWYCSIIDIANIVANSFELIFNAKLKINIKDKYPLIPNNFEYTSKFNLPYVEKNYSINMMNKVIKDLFKRRIA